MIKAFEDKFEVSYEVYRELDEDYEALYFCDKLGQLMSFMRSLDSHEHIEIALVYDSFSRKKDAEIACVTNNVEDMVSEVKIRAEVFVGKTVRYVH